MARKKAEVRVRDMTNLYGWRRHKYGDVRYCMHCHMPQPKTERAPDFLISIVSTYVEAKNSDSTGRWNWSEMLPDGSRANQREWLLENGGWLFIELGEGRAPSGVGAWLIPFDAWVEEVEPELLERGQKSLRLETQYNKDGTPTRGHIGGDLLLSRWSLVWEQKVGWTIPDDHTWWSRMKFALIQKLESLP